MSVEGQGTTRNLAEVEVKFAYFASWLHSKYLPMIKEIKVHTWIISVSIVKFKILNLSVRLTFQFKKNM